MGSDTSWMPTLFAERERGEREREPQSSAQAIVASSKAAERFCWTQRPLLHMGARYGTCGDQHSRSMNKWRDD